MVWSNVLGSHHPSRTASAGWSLGASKSTESKLAYFVDLDGFLVLKRI
jgi:hypothetical protein